MDEKLPPPGRRVLVLRHGERVDRVFAHWVENWLDRTFMPPNCIYKRWNLNLPRAFPVRSTDELNSFDISDYAFDVPLSAIGEGAAEALGYHTSFTSWTFTDAYTSPSLRCMQTATRYLKGLQNGGVSTDHLLPLKVENGFFDYLGFVEYMLRGIPNFVPPEWLKTRGIMVSTNYKPSTKREDLVVKSEQLSTLPLYQRVAKALKKILTENSAPHPKFGPQSILIVTHAPIVDTISQILLRKPRRDETLKDVSNYLKYMGTLAFEEVRKNQWRLIPPPVRTFRYAVNPYCKPHRVLLKEHFPDEEEQEG